MTFKKTLLLITTVLVLTCCRGRINIEGSFANNSNDTLIMTTNSGEQITLLPHSNQDTKYIGGFDAKNKSKESRQFDCCPCVLKENTFSIKPIKTSKTLIKNVFDKSNWTVEKTKGDIKCGFFIEQADIQ